ncbi:MAG: response regulator [Actinomycetota bacterium]
MGDVDVPAGGGGSPVLVVDDDEMARELVVRYLHKLNLRNPVVPAGDGGAAIEALQAMDGAPCLVLLDLHMPVRSGLEVLDWIRAQPALSRVPVVMLTASATLDDIDEAYRLGIASYLVKPVGFPGLVDVLRELALPWMLLPTGADGAPA